MSRSAQKRSKGSELVGLVPAAGQATRIAPLPCSKEVYPIGLRETDGGQVRPKVSCHFLLEKMQRAGADKAFVVLRKGKWDIPAYFGDGRIVGMQLAYLMMHLPYGAPYSIDQAFPFVQKAGIIFGFPDILFHPEDGFEQLIRKQAQTGADVVLGLFPTLQTRAVDMVDLDGEGRVKRIVIKPEQTSLRYAWLIAVWTPVFTRFMHTHLKALSSGADPAAAGATEEVFVGDVIQAAIDSGLAVFSVRFDEGWYIDIGTPEGLLRAVSRNSTRTVAAPSP